MSTGKSSKRKNQSICENSTLIAANLVRASSFALAEMAFGSPPDRGARAAPIEASPVLQRDPPVSMRRVVTQSRSTGYLREPDHGKSVDASAAEFIHKVRQRNRSDGAMVADISDSCIPPPPLYKWAT